MSPSEKAWLWFSGDVPRVGPNCVAATDQFLDKRDGGVPCAEYQHRRTHVTGFSVLAPLLPGPVGDATARHQHNEQQCLHEKLRETEFPKPVAYPDGEAYGDRTGENAGDDPLHIGQARVSPQALVHAEHDRHDRLDRNRNREQQGKREQGLDGTDGGKRLGKQRKRNDPRNDEHGHIVHERKKGALVNGYCLHVASRSLFFELFFFFSFSRHSIRSGSNAYVITHASKMASGSGLRVAQSADPAAADIRP